MDDDLFLQFVFGLILVMLIQKSSDRQGDGDVILPSLDYINLKHSPTLIPTVRSSTNL